MKVAVLSLTRDRAEYTRHCFEQLELLAGCDYDHYVLDQASTDGTLEWLFGWSSGRTLERWRAVVARPDNIGIHRGMNALLANVAFADRRRKPYDVVVKLDNDCELVEPDTLRRCCEVALELDAIVSPEIHGLRGVKFPIDYDLTVEASSGVLGCRPMIGGIFMAIPATVFTERGYRFDEHAPLWGTDDDRLCDWFRHDRPIDPSKDGYGHGWVGYLVGCRANHFETTDGQHERFPGYFDRRVAEGGPV